MFAGFLIMRAAWLYLQLDRKSVLQAVQGFLSEGYAVTRNFGAVGSVEVSGGAGVFFFFPEAYLAQAECKYAHKFTTPTTLKYDTDIKTLP